MAEVGIVKSVLRFPCIVFCGAFSQCLLPHCVLWRFLPVPSPAFRSVVLSPGTPKCILRRVRPAVIGDRVLPSPASRRTGARRTRDSRAAGPGPGRWRSARPVRRPSCSATPVFVCVVCVREREASLLDASQHFSMLLDASRRLSTPLNTFDGSQHFSMLLDASRRLSTLLDASRRSDTLLDALSQPIRQLSPIVSPLSSADRQIVTQNPKS